MILKYCFDENDTDYGFEIERYQLVSALADIIAREQGNKDNFENNRKFVKELIEDAVIDEDEMADRYEMELLEYFEDEAREEYKDCIAREENDCFYGAFWRRNR